jgi:hypothetical protein
MYVFAAIVNELASLTSISGGSLLAIVLLFYVDFYT